MTNNKKPPRERLWALITRAGYSISELSKKLDYASVSGLSRYTNEKAGDRAVPYDVIKRLTPYLLNAGNPPITMEELLACTDVKAMPKPVVAAFQETVVEDGDGLVVVRYRVERGVFVRPEETRSYGASRIGVAKEYPQASQFVAVLGRSRAELGPVGTQLHCVSPELFAPSARVGRKVVVGVREGNLIEVRVGVVQSVNTDGDATILSYDTEHLNGVILGVVIGLYRRETNEK